MNTVDLKKGSTEKVENYFHRISNGYKVKQQYQEIAIDKIESVLKAIDKYSPDARDAIFCLLNDELPSLFPNAGNYKLCDGSSTAHIGSFVGILMRNKTKLDREGRDQWIKPLREIGAIDAYTFDTEDGFLPGHIKAKSPYSCYRLNPSFIEILKEYGEKGYGEVFKTWIAQDSIRARLEIQQSVERATREMIVGNPHKILIQNSIEIYARHFLDGYILVYKDDSDGDRISIEEKKLMEKYGIKLGLEDAFPDIILYNEKSNSLWFIEAVTSDGEVDEHKFSALRHICYKSGKVFAGATTTYDTWKTFAKRQQSHKNLADTSKVWILEDPQKQFEVDYCK